MYTFKCCLKQPPTLRVAELEALLASQDKVLDVVVAEAEEIAEKFGRPRRTALVSEDPGEWGFVGRGWVGMQSV